MICVDDPKTTNIDGKYEGPFWCFVGGGIKLGESIRDAAKREIYEETGIAENDVQLGPIVWSAKFEFIRIGKPICMHEQFIVTKTNKKRY